MIWYDSNTFMLPVWALKSAPLRIPPGICSVGLYPNHKAYEDDAIIIAVFSLIFKFERVFQKYLTFLYIPGYPSALKDDCWHTRTPNISMSPHFVLWSHNHIFYDLLKTKFPLKLPSHDFEHVKLLEWINHLSINCAESFICQTLVLQVS